MGLRLVQRSIIDLKLDYIFEKFKLKLFVDNQHPWEPEPFDITGGDLGIWPNLELLGDWLRSATTDRFFCTHQCINWAWY